MSSPNLSLTVNNGTSLFNDFRNYGAKGDGVTDDTTACQNAINAVSAAGGGEIIAANGLNFYVQTLIPASNVTIRGYGAKFTKNPASVYGIISNIVAKAALTNFNVYGVTFIGEGQAYGNTAVSTTERRSAMSLYNCTRCTVQDCYVNGFAWAGFEFPLSNGIRVIDNQLVNCCTYGLGNAIAIQFNVTGSTSYPTDIVISGNTITGAGTACICLGNYQLNTSPFNARIHHNNCTTNAFTCIAIEIANYSGSATTGYQTRQVQIDHNICTQTAAAGSGASGIGVGDNNATTRSNDALEFADIIIDHNIVISSDNGIVCQSSRAQVDRNNVTAATNGITMQGNNSNTPNNQEVSGNIVTMAINGSSGIAVLTTDSPTIVDNRVIYPANSTTGASGILIFQCINPHIMNNRVNYAPVHGIYLNGNTGNVCNNNTVYNANQTKAATGSAIMYVAPASQGRQHQINSNRLWDDQSTTTGYAAINISGSQSLLEVSYNRSSAISWTYGGGTPYVNVYASVVKSAVSNMSDATPQNVPSFGPVAVTVGASPYTYSNTNPYPVQVFLVGGTVSAMTYQKRGFSTATHFGSVDPSTRTFVLDIGDAIVMTYSVAPAMTVYGMST